MAAIAAIFLSPAVASISSPASRYHERVNSRLRPQSYTPITASKPNPRFTFLRVETARVVAVALKRRYRVLAATESLDCSSNTDPDGEPSDSNTNATIDIKLPRRSLLVQFTCNCCSVRTERLINRLAYEKGLVYVQCAGCLKHHKLVDNLGLAVEYDLRQNSVEPSAEQV